MCLYVGVISGTAEPILIFLWPIVSYIVNGIFEKLIIFGDLNGGGEKEEKKGGFHSLVPFSNGSGMAKLDPSKSTNRIHVRTSEIVYKSLTP